MKKIYYSIAFISASLFSYSQSNTVASGGNGTGTGGSVSYTVGQIDYINSSGSNGNVHQGVQQPFEFYKEVGLDESELLNLSLYPNPTNEFIIIKLGTFIDDLSYRLYDINGKILKNEVIKEAETKLDFRIYATGEYHLTITNQDKIIQSLKIIKN